MSSWRVVNRGSNRPAIGSAPQPITASAYAVLAQGIPKPSQFRRADHNRGRPPLYFLVAPASRRLTCPESSKGDRVPSCRAARCYMSRGQGGATNTRGVP